MAGRRMTAPPGKRCVFGPRDHRPVERRSTGYAALGRRSEFFE